MLEFFVVVFFPFLGIVAGLWASWRLWGSFLTIQRGAFWLATVLLCILGVGTALFQYNQSKADQWTFTQFFNGVETGTSVERTQCDYNGSCKHTYRCAPYTETTIDSNGHIHIKDVDNYCPYSSEEDTWSIHTNLGDVTVATGRFPDRPHAYDGESSQYSTIPQAIQNEAGVGTPPDITEAQRRIDEGDPRPAFQIQQYANYIAPSDAALIKVTSDRVHYWQKNLPIPPVDVTEYDQARKAMLVGLPQNMAWNDAVSRVDMEAGLLPVVKQRFDFWFVAINSRLVSQTQADEYVRALDAYWQSSTFGSASFPKNVAAIVVGTDGKIVQWARGFTLIPGNNNDVLWQQVMTELPGTAFQPSVLVGTPKAVLGQKIRIQQGSGAIERLLLAGFHRPSGSQFSYLASEIQPDTWTCWRIVLVSVFVALLLFNVTAGIVYWYSNE